MVFEDGAQGCRDVGRREPAGCDLIEQRLKQMKVAPVDRASPLRVRFLDIGLREARQSLRQLRQPDGFLPR